VAELLSQLGADVVAADPHVPAHRFPRGSSAFEATAAELGGADAVVLLVDHDAFDVDLIVAHSRMCSTPVARLPKAKHCGAPVTAAQTVVVTGAPGSSVPTCAAFCSNRRASSG